VKSDRWGEERKAKGKAGIFKREEDRKRRREKSWTRSTPVWVHWRDDGWGEDDLNGRLLPMQGVTTATQRAEEGRKVSKTSGQASQCNVLIRSISNSEVNEI
jgi:hypothetical protein